MRARYTAFATGNVKFIVDSHDPDTAGDIDHEGTERWSKESEWVGLEIHATEAGGETDHFGQVEFTANYKFQGTPIAHRERATFRKQGDTWLFVDGEQIAGPPVRREGPKLGRNDPCSCGSGKKFKKCCGKEAA